MRAERLKLSISKNRGVKDIDERLKRAKDPKAVLSELKAGAVEVTEAREGHRTDAMPPLRKTINFESFEVLGENQDGKVLFWSSLNRKIYIHDLKSLQYDQLVQLGGPEILKKVGRGKRYYQSEEDGSSLIPFPEVKTNLIIEASRRQLGELSYFGQGIHALKDGNHLLIVNGGRGWIWDGNAFQEQDHPLLDGRLIDWNAGRVWIDFEQVMAMAGKMTPILAKEVIDEVCLCVNQWGFADQQDAGLFAGWVLAQIIQGVWNWRPHLWLTGAAGTGKTLLISFLEGLAGPLAMRREGKSLTEAGFRQDMANDGVRAFLDEFELSEHRDDLIEYLRSASRGGTIVKGTTSQKPVHFFIKHMVLLASIEYRLARAAERSRFLVVELLKDDLRCPIIPNAKKMEALRLKVCAFAIWGAFRAKKLISQLGRIAGFEDRFTESFGVPLSMITLCEENAIGLLGEMVKVFLDKARRDDRLDHITDEERLIRDVGFAKIRIPEEQRISEDRTSIVYRELTVSQAIAKLRHGGDDGLYDDAMQAHGIKVTDDGSLFMVPEIVSRKLLRDTLWGELNIEPILKRITGTKKGRRRIAARLTYGLLVPYAEKLSDQSVP